jgi:hypothetical protein
MAAPRGGSQLREAPACHATAGIAHILLQGGEPGELSNESNISPTVTDSGPKRPTPDSILKIALAVCAVMVALALAAHYLVYVPMRDHAAALAREHQAQVAAQVVRENLARQAKARADQAASVKVGLDTCLTGADADYKVNWDHSCLARGLKSGCDLPSYETDAIVKTRENTKARCVEVAKYGLPPTAR